MKKASRWKTTACVMSPSCRSCLKAAPSLMRKMDPVLEMVLDLEKVLEKAPEKALETGLERGLEKDRQRRLKTCLNL
jgi:hypothetical protein